MESNVDSEKNSYECAVCLKKYSAKKALKTHISQFNHKICSDIPAFLKPYLPKSYRINHVSSKKITKNAFLAKTVLPDVSDISSVHEWVDEFSRHNNCIYSRRMVSKHPKSSKMILREVYFCYHYGPEKGTGRKKKLKGTNCQSKITVALKNGSPNFTAVTINFDHNHPLESVKSRLSNPFANLKEIFIKMFENGANASEALKNYQIHIETQLANGISHLQNPIDRKLQDYDWIRHLFQKTYENKYYPTKSIQLTDTIVNHIDNINEEYNTSICLWRKIADDFAVVIVTPVMRRVAEVRQTNELFVDSIGSSSIYGLMVYLLMTQLENIAVPIGAVISSSDSYDVLSQAFSLYSEFSDELRSTISLVVMDDHSEKEKALKFAFPNTQVLSCPIHFLRSCRRWLIKHENMKNDRDKIYGKIHQMVYTPEETTLDALFAELKNFNLKKKFSNYLDSLYLTKEQWSLCYRKKYSLQNTSHICLEHDIRLLRNDLLDIIKMQSLDPLITFIICDLSDAFSSICADRCLNKVEKTQPIQFDKYSITQNSDYLFTVLHKEKKIFYEINTCIAICTCSTGCMGAYCKHQQIVAHAKAINQVQQFESEKLQILLYYVVTGEIDVPSNFSKSNPSENLSENIEVIEVAAPTNADFSIIEVVDLEMLQNEPEPRIQDQLEEFKSHISDICEKVQSHPAYFFKALADLNKHLDVIKRNPAAILKTMSSIESEYVFDLENDSNQFLVTAVSPSDEDSIFEINIQTDESFND